MNDQPLVSIVITSFNHGNMIENAINSALNQKYENIEIIISDNNSTDNTSVILNNYKDRKNIHINYNATNIGMLPNFKLAIEKLSHGEYIISLNSDDYLTDEYFISKAVSLVARQPTIKIVLGRYMGYNTKSKIYTSHSLEDIFKDDIVKPETIVKYISNYGLDWISWAGAFFHRNTLIMTNFSEINEITFDQLVNLEMMLNNDTGFINSNVYCFVFHGNNAHLTSDVHVHHKHIIQLDKILSQGKEIENKDIINEILLNEIHSRLKGLYIVDRKAYSNFKYLVYNSYKDLYQQVQLRPNFIFIKLLFYFPTIGNILLKAKQAIIK